MSVIDYGKETVLYDARNKSVHALNPAAMSIWRHCDGATTVTALKEALADEFSGVVDGPDLERDIHTAIAQFREQGLLE
ncbi:MAG: HPr-rel-A system PqqD family peptide chaperone [Candidatus Hydrogenedentes bacterium]|nr:HPr-rel-A system PqqD family peptide chaperone [Candidatus Hydrogenedentota bacterium]